MGRGASAAVRRMGPLVIIGDWLLIITIFTSIFIRIFSIIICAVHACIRLLCAGHHVHTTCGFPVLKMTDNLSALWFPAYNRYPILQSCWSESNLTSFMVWFHHKATLAEQNWAAGHLYSWEHASASGQRREPLLLRKRDGALVQLPVRRCTAHWCMQCLARRGGWDFRWTDPRWTPIASLRLDYTEEKHYEMAIKPWPMGILEAPAPSAQAQPPPPAPLGSASGPSNSTSPPSPQGEASSSSGPSNNTSLPSPRSEASRSSGNSSGGPPSPTLTPAPRFYVYAGLHQRPPSPSYVDVDSGWSEADLEENELLGAPAASDRCETYPDGFRPGETYPDGFRPAIP